jgi:hypothetical protein
MDVHALVADRHQLAEPLGRGAMGDVWGPTDPSLNPAGRSETPVHRNQ